MHSSKTYVGVVFGGASSEHNVSIQSAATVIKALQTQSNASKFAVKLIYIDQQGRWWSENVAQKALQKGSALHETELPSPIASKGFKELPRESEQINIWYPVLHGPNGEDGTVQGLFKLMKKPFVGSGVLASAIGMDKLAMKAAFKAVGLPQVPYSAAFADELLDNDHRFALLSKLETQLGYPCFIKPANLGSSVGITKASNKNELLEGLKTAAKHDYRMVVEKAVIARELECAVIGNKTLETSAVGEVRFEADWYDYETKYSHNSSQSIIPAPIPKGISDKVKELTLQACKAISSHGLARVDFFYQEETHEIWINEINTLPGFTTQSMYPMLWESVGVTLEQLVAKLVETARE
ncbi:MAG: D-alanine--D-alanine ligase family protein [Prochlorococcaceae cyanobacterium ETNP1_MAG_9]|nr:D-alanine--D-alanine ligase family protein [Prochlorococcaceae cyanobacterium ETNP1_MAG_9]